MPLSTKPQRIFVAGASSFLGASVVYALLEAGVEVTALLPPEATLRLGEASHRVRQAEGDPWNRGSLTGRSRGHSTVIHLIGSIRQQPTRGLTYHHINFASLQNITRMAISDGVPHLLFVSAAWAPWLPGEYLRSKREAERYLQRSGIDWTIIRAPLIHPRRRVDNPLLTINGLFGSIPLLGWPSARWAPLPVDVAARGIVHLALDARAQGRIAFGRDLWKRGRMAAAPPRPSVSEQGPEEPSPPSLAEADEPPFGWLPKL